ncbi:TraR/DksA family transcriptional regulator [Cellulomonas sp. P22]|uniref:TraR/DksA family transcriptional regulator n=1 Tax=Cellulomonas sp. P22 TaxID=3373189 RepID=UPI00378939C6
MTRERPDLPDEEHLRARLRALRTEAVERHRASLGDVTDIVDASRDTSTDDEHDPEGATIAFERAQADALARSAVAQVAEIDAALARLDAGTYGRCEVCGEPVAAARLEARPAARTCIRCASNPRHPGDLSR